MGSNNIIGQPEDNKLRLPQTTPVAGAPDTGVGFPPFYDFQIFTIPSRLPTVGL
jgi:hypothetical protein